MGKMDEMILVAKRSALFGENDELVFQGVATNKELVTKIISHLSQNIKVMRRGDAEENPTYKQPIPYVVIKKGNQIYAYKRLSGGGEARLHSKLSIGFGGHINQTNDVSFVDILMTNLQRELDEELEIKCHSYRLKPVGLINDDNNEVGKVHIGLLYTFEIDNEAIVEVKEKDQIEGFWIDIKNLKNEEIYSNLESWSQFVADVLN
jgi:predicted NUDIX family phosphoesterase